MRHRPRHVVVVVAAVAAALTLVAAGLPGPANALDASGIELRLVATPATGTAIAARAGDKTLYIAEQSGTIRALRGETLADTPVLDLTDVVSAGGERGLLGLAFSPDGTRMYVHYTNRDGDSEIVEFGMRADGVDAGSRRLLLTVEQPQANHNGGQIAFGPDRMLYIALGDGGASGDAGPGHRPEGNGQALDTLLGKLLRIDPTPSTNAPYTVPRDNPFVGRSGALPEIWSYGLRNPWRFTFDDETGDLWIGDVGQSAWEEVNFVPAVDGVGAGRGDNFGWARLEGTHPFSGTAPANAVPPVHEFAHTDGSCSVTGGYVYRGKRIRELRGTYLFVDYCRDQIMGLTPDNGGFSPVDLDTQVASVSTFGQRNNGELYVLSQTDGLYRILPA